MYVEFGTKLFTQSAFSGVSNLVLSKAYYNTTMFEQLLKKFVGETPLIKTNADEYCPKVSRFQTNYFFFSYFHYFSNRFSHFQLASVSTVMNQSSIMPYVFRNYSLPCDRQSQYLGSCKYTLFESVRASGAAPTVFQEFCLDGMIHQVINSATLLRIRSRRRRRKGKQRRHVSSMTQLCCVVFTRSNTCRVINNIEAYFFFFW